MLAFDSFKTEFSKILRETEVRRKSYLMIFYKNVAISLVLLGVVSFFGSSILNVFFHTSRTDTVADSNDVTALFLCVLMISVFLILRPIYLYRGNNRTAALVTFRSHRFSLKDHAYSALFKFFGPLEFAPRGGISLLEMRNSTIFPEYELYLSEDLTVGPLHDVTAKFCEANIVQVRDRKRVSVFSGLLLVFDISESKLKLRSNFKGRTAVIYDDKKKIEEIAEKYKEMQRFDLPEAFEPTLEGYTSNVTEAKEIITAELLESIQSFAQRLANLKQQVEHFDSKLAHAAAETYDYSKEKLSMIVGKRRLPSEIEYDEMHATGLDITKGDPLSDSPLFLNEHFEVEFYDDKLVVTLPCKYDLFETDSLFEQALNNEDAELLYSLMQMVDSIARHLNTIKK